VAKPSDSLVRPLVVFVLLALLALAVVAIAGISVAQSLATDQALDDARQITEISSRVVERRIDNQLLTGDAESLAAVDRATLDAVLVDPVVRVKIWTDDGEIVYSDQPNLIGSTYKLGQDEIEVIEDGGVVAEVSDLSAPENRFERQFGELLEVYTKVATPGGAPLLFETYQLASRLDDRRSELLATFVPVLVATLVALAILMIPIGWILARRVRAAQLERERLMRRALDASDRERRRIAGDVHDGPVQELAGLSMRLAASAEQIDDPSARDAMLDSASAVRGSVRTLRSAIVGIYPPNLQQAGLSASLSDLVARLEPYGIDASLVMDEPAGFTPEVDAVLYRTCQETLRNVEEHAGARRVRVSVRHERGRAVLEILDDGRGFDRVAADEAREEGHLGLEILQDLARDAEGTLTIGPADDGPGTLVRMEVPV
jgi:two-component system, NarL family, sensor kinase